MKLLAGIIEGNDIGFGNDPLDMTSKAQAI